MTEITPSALFRILSEVTHAVYVGYDGCGIHDYDIRLIEEVTFDKSSGRYIIGERDHIFSEVAIGDKFTPKKIIKGKDGEYIIDGVCFEFFNLYTK